MDNNSSDHSNIDKNKESSNSRRSFFRKFGVIGASAVAGGAAVYSGLKYEESKPNHDMVKVLTADNKLVEVPRDQIKDVKLDLTELQKQGREGLKGHRFVM